MTPRPIIRTSDRNSFRRCRVSWNYSSKLRMNMEYSQGVEPLDFGTAVHEGLEVYYDPKTWAEPREVVEAEALNAFNAYMKTWMKRINDAGQWETQKNRYYELIELGEGMLKHYYMYAPSADEDWIPKFVEVEFEVPIPVNSDSQLTGGFEERPIEGLEGTYLHTLHEGEWIPVYYQGRIDLIVEDKRTGKYWIVDHKTAAMFGGTEWLELDPQCGSYVWAIKKMLNIDIEGVIYSQLRKKAPEPPATLKSGHLSKNKSQNTTVQLFRAEIKRLNLDPDFYEEFLQDVFIGQEYFRRIEMNRTEDEMEEIGRNIFDEAIDMLGNPRIYPNPGMFNCGGCQWRQPCIMRQDGSDHVWFVEQSGLYNKRGGTN